MTNLNDIINLAKADGGKFFVMDESGEVKLIIMNIEEYQRMLLGKLKRQVEDIEKINKEIIKAQLEEIHPIPPAPSRPPAFAPQTDTRENRPPAAAFGQRAAPELPNRMARVDLREEVLDPSFEFEGPKAEIDDL